MGLLLYILFFSSRRRHTRLVSDWSSDVCSSDLDLLFPVGAQRVPAVVPDHGGRAEAQRPTPLLQLPAHIHVVAGGAELRIEIGRASCRERGYIWVVGESCCNTLIL